MSEARHSFTVRPFAYGDARVSDDPRLWKLSRDGLLRGRYCIVAIAEDGVLAGYCTFDFEEGKVIRLSMLESRILGAGSKMLDELKARTVELIAEDVAVASKAWWKRRSFKPTTTRSREAGTVGHYRWRRRNDERFDGTPLLPIWPTLRKVHEVQIEGMDQERLVLAIATLVAQANILPVTLVPDSLVLALREALARGQVAPEAAKALQGQLAVFDAMEGNDLQRNLAWYMDAHGRLRELGASEKLLDVLQAVMRRYVYEVERARGAEYGTEPRGDTVTPEPSAE